MKRILLITGSLFLMFANITAEEVSNKAIATNDATSVKTDYFADGSIKIVVNVAKINTYLKWVAAADSTVKFNPAEGLNMNNLLAFKESYNNIELSAVREMHKLLAEAQKTETKSTKFNVQPRR